MSTPHSFNFAHTDVAFSRKKNILSQLSLSRLIVLPTNLVHGNLFVPHPDHALTCSALFSVPCSEGLLLRFMVGLVLKGAGRQEYPRPMTRA